MEVSDWGTHKHFNALYELKHRRVMGINPPPPNVGTCYGVEAPP